MQKQFDNIEKTLTKNIYVLFQNKFDGNNSKFAIACDCSETTIRRVFLNKQRMTLNLFLRFCSALEVNASDLLKEINL